MMGPMRAMVRGPCDGCKGQGKMVETVCPTCDGKKFRTEERVIEAVIRPGARPGEVLRFPNECSDQEEYDEPGDFHIVLQEADEDIRFRRMAPTSDDLTVRTTISLENALLGCKEKMDGHPGHQQGIVVDIPAGVQNGETFVVDGEGLPGIGVGAPGGKGKLFVTVEVRASVAEKAALLRGAEAIRALFRV